MICLLASKQLGFLVRSGEAVDKLVCTPDGVQWKRVPEWSDDPLSAIAFAQGGIYGHCGTCLSPTKPALKPLPPPLSLLFSSPHHPRNGFSNAQVCVGSVA